jgi:hypothetical protein
MEELIIEEKFTRCPQCQSFSLKVSDDLTSKERLKNLLIPVTVYKCNNCSYRYVEFGNFTDTLKNIFFALVNRVERKWLLAVVPLAVIVAAAALIWLLPGNSNNGTPPVDPVDKKPVVVKGAEDKKEEVKKEEVKKEEDPPPETKMPVDPVVENQGEGDTSPADTQTAVESTEPPALPAISAHIVLGNSNRFGVNWSRVERGVQISRLSDGPLKRAGIRLGDILAEVDEQKITSGNNLLGIRNLIFTGRKEEAVIKVYRGEETLYFKLVKRIKPQTRLEGSVPARPEATVTDASAGVVKVFSQTTIKMRSSAPDRVNDALKWSFSIKEITIRRSGSQQVFIAGDASGSGKWAVDDQLIINGNAFAGLNGTYEQESGPLPPQAKRIPLDITHLVPPERETVLKVELADHGKRWGNTDIYIIIKPVSSMTTGLDEDKVRLALSR